MKWKILILVLFSALSAISSASESKSGIPVIVISDLYIPAQDAGDNFDIVTPYALEEINLLGVIFDISENFRKYDPVHGGPRDPGFIAVQQLNYIFNRHVPSACGPFTKMKDPLDRMEYIPPFESQGFRLFFELLENSEYKVEVVSTGSARFLAAAYNREPALMKEKIRMVHLCAGASSPAFMEWNVELDPAGMYRMLTCELPVTIYPCATDKGPFDLGQNNTFWALFDMDFVLEMDEALKRYIVYSLTKSTDINYLNFIDKPLSKSDLEAFSNYDKGKNYGPGGKHYVWETAIWLNISGRKLVRKKDGKYRIVKASELEQGDVINKESFEPCLIEASTDGLFSFRYCKPCQTNFRIYFRENPERTQLWLNTALPEFYKNFSID